MAEIDNGMGAAEFEDWWRYYQEEPFGTMRENLNAGIIAAAVVNCRQGRKRGSADVKPSDFLMKSRREAVDERASETQRSLGILRAMGVRKSRG